MAGIGVALAARSLIGYNGPWNRTDKRQILFVQRPPMQLNDRDNDPLHAPINAVLAQIVESASVLPPWYDAWM